MVDLEKNRVVFCKSCKNSICEYNNRGRLEIICPHCRVTNSLIGERSHTIGAFNGDFVLDSIKISCKKCYRPIAKVEDGAKFKLNCRVCKTENNTFISTTENLFLEKETVEIELSL